VISGAGTSEAAWRRWTFLAHLPPFDFRRCTRAVVLAPHPDDETLGLGGLISRLLADGLEVVVVTATDGEASHPLSSVIGRDELRERRVAEAAAALGFLADTLPGAARGDRLRLPDGGLADAEGSLADLLTDVLRPGDWCFATWDGDGHPDHEAAAWAARTACGRSGADYHSYPIWTWHWALPGEKRVPWGRARSVSLPAWAQERKARAISCYESQTLPLGREPGDAAILPPGDLAHFARHFEVIFE